MSPRVSFSQQVKQELTERLRHPEGSDRPDAWSPEERDLTFAFILLTHATFRGGTARIASAHTDLIEAVSDWLQASFPEAEPTVTSRGRRVHLALEDRGYTALTDRLQETLGFEPVRGRIGADAESLGPEGRRAFMRALMLTQGSMANPKRAYQLELVVRRRALAPLAEAILVTANLDHQSVQKDLHRYVYLKSGDDIAHFLAWIGAQQAVLAFENIRAERELRGQVNRQVNFDSANSSRVARSAARQHAAIQKIRAAGAFEDLPEDLAQVARAREAHPYDTLEELGAVLEPKVGKSGVRHRLNRLIAFAEHLGDV